ncbi:hypothetical protein ACFX1R_046223 [Malus domestica]
MRYSCSSVACLQRYYKEEKKLSISSDSAESALSDVKKSWAFFFICRSAWLWRMKWELQTSRVLTLLEHFEKVVCGIWKTDVACEDCRQVLSKEIWFLKFGERCLFSFRTSNPVGDLNLEIQRTVPLQFLRKQSCWEFDS